VARRKLIWLLSLAAIAVITWLLSRVSSSPRQALQISFVGYTNLAAGDTAVIFIVSNQCNVTVKRWAAAYFESAPFSSNNLPSQWKMAAGPIMDSYLKPGGSEQLWIKGTPAFGGAWRLRIPWSVGVRAKLALTFRDYRKLPQYLRLAPEYYACSESIERHIAVAENSTDSEAIFGVYAQLTHRTVLHTFSASRLSVKLDSQDPSGTIARIEAALADAGFELVRDGEQFVRILPSNWRKSPMAEHLARLKPPAAKSSTKKTAGTIAFKGADLDMVLAIYADLSQRTILKGPLGMPQFWLISEGSLTGEEVIYALNTLLILNGIVAMDDGDKLVQVVSSADVRFVQPHAPKASPGEVTIDPKEIPKFYRFSPGRPAAKPASGPSALYSDDVDGLVAYYASLTGKNAVPAGQPGRMQIYFQPTTALTKPELIYALETTLALNFLAIVPAGDNFITVTPKDRSRR
jgi:hypothetical protein